MRTTLLTVLFLAGPAAAQNAGQVCAKIPYSDQKVECVRAISGHEVQAEAAQVCGTIPYADQTVRCMGGIVDKTYDDGELEACRSIPYADQKADCMASAGRKAKRRVARRDDDDDDQDRDRRRRNRDDDDSRQRFDSTVTFENRSNNATMTRYYWREPGGRWTEFGGRRKLRGQSQLSLEAASGLYDFCAETSDGRSVYWARIRLESNEERIWFKASNLEELDCRDR